MHLLLEYVLETFPFDREEVYGMHIETPSMKAKENFINRYMKRMTEDTLNIDTDDGKRFH